jgi:hypothetical protein
LLVHRKLSGHFKILLESVKCDFEEISNKYYFSKTIYFQLNHEENGKYNSSSKNQLESEKKWRF